MNQEVDLWLGQHELVDFEESGVLPSLSVSKWSFYYNLIKKMANMPFYRSKEAYIDPTATLMGQIVIEEGVRILPYAMITGPAFIGKNTIIGNYSFIRPNSFISRNVVIGNHSYCNETIIAPYSRVTHFCGVSRSILERNCTLSAFVLTASLKANSTAIDPQNRIKKRGALIGKNTYIAPHVSISPSVEIGADCFIGSFLYLTQNVAENQMLRTKKTIETDINTYAFPERIIAKDNLKNKKFYCATLLISEENKYILQRRDSSSAVTNPGMISAFGGRLEGDETPIQCAIRELNEELSLKIDESDLGFLYRTKVLFDGKIIECIFFIIKSIKIKDLCLTEGKKIEHLSPFDCLMSKDITDLCLSAVQTHFESDEKFRKKWVN
ncbi:MAG: NUDIX domain-containing protein [Cyclobacteriaceae bacterium]